MRRVTHLVSIHAPLAVEPRSQRAECSELEILGQQDRHQSSNFLGSKTAVPTMSRPAIWLALGFSGSR